MTAAPALMPPPQTVIAPRPGSNQVDALGQRSRQESARMVLQSHRAGLEARRSDDLVREKLLMHVDGTGDAQWADIIFGSRVEIPRFVSEYRKTENVLRLLVENAVAHHTTMPLKYFAESRPDRRSRDQALIDSLWINHLAQQQDFNGLFSEGLYMAMPTGFTPVHAYWRDDRNDQYEPTSYGGQTPGPVPGMIDCWVGNPFDTVFDRGARRGSAYWCSYGRVLPAQMVRDAFAHIPEARSLEGTSRLPSASLFQRIARSWQSAGMGVHGSGVMGNRRKIEDEDELILVICRETLPGVDTKYPDGRLQIIAVPGTADLRNGEGHHAIKLADQALPGGDFSWSLFYSSHRIDDIHGKPWVEELDQLQLDLNIALSKRWEFTNKITESPLAIPGGAITDDMTDIGGFNVLEYDPGVAGGSFRPRAIEWQTEALQALTKEVEERRRALYTAGGYQAASRGEAPGSRMAYRAIVALQSADRTIHGPINERFRRSACDFARRCWKQMKMYGDVPWLITIAGDEYAHLAEPYVDRTKLSVDPPAYKLVNAFGPTPELMAEEVVQLLSLKGADGKAFITTEQARRMYPNPAIFDDSSDPKAVARRRARTIAARFHVEAQRFREQTGFEERSIAHPATREAANRVFGVMETNYPRLRDDDLQSHLDAISEITQDETADPIARLAAMQRQELLYQWQAQMAATPMTGIAPRAGAPAGPGQEPSRPTVDRRGVAAEMQGGRRVPAIAR